MGHTDLESVWVLVCNMPLFPAKLKKNNTNNNKHPKPITKNNTIMQQHHNNKKSLNTSTKTTSKGRDHLPGRRLANERQQLKK